MTIQGYSRLGAAHAFLLNADEAEKAYRKGLEIDPNNEQLKNELDALNKKFSGLLLMCFHHGHVTDILTHKIVFFRSWKKCSTG